MRGGERGRKGERVGRREEERGGEKEEERAGERVRRREEERVAVDLTWLYVIIMDGHILVPVCSTLLMEEAEGM